MCIMHMHMHVHMHVRVCGEGGAYAAPAPLYLEYHFARVGAACWRRAWTAERCELLGDQREQRQLGR